MAKPIPPPDVPLVDVLTGRVTQIWYDFLLGVDKRKFTELSDVSKTAPTNGQVFTWNSTTKLFTPAAN